MRGRDGLLGLDCYWNLASCRRPRLSADIQAGIPDCIHIPYISKTDKGVIKAIVDSYFVRFRVKNNGRKTPAENVLAFLETVEVLVDSKYETLTSFIPLQLTWSDLGFLYFPSIHRGIDTHCELGFILGPAGRDGFKEENITPRETMNDDLYFCFNTFVKPNSLSSIVPFGDYRATIKIAAPNAVPIRVIIQIHVPKKWEENETEMYKSLNPKITKIAKVK